MFVNTLSSAEPTRLILGAADDPAEHAADRAAAGAIAHGSARVAPAGPVSGRLLDRDVQARIERSYPAGQPIPEIDRVPLEGSFDTDFSHVRLHSGTEADALCRLLDARAFTVDGHVFVDRAYRPGTIEGRRLLAHELAHVRHAETGVVRRYVPKGKYSNETVDTILEKLLDPKTYQSDHFTTASSGLPPDKLKAFQAKGAAFIDALFASDVDRATIIGVITSFVTNEDEVSYLNDVYAALLAKVNFFPDFEPHLEPWAGVKLALTGVDAVVNQAFVPVNSGTLLDVHPTNVEFTAQVAVNLDQPNLVNQFTVGLIQNVTYSTKRITLIRPDNSARVVSVWLTPQTFYDGGGEDYPWYDNIRARARLGEARQEPTVVLTDRPGFSLPKQEDETLHELTGSDCFRTWLAIRHVSGDLAFVYYWDWQIDYDTHNCTVTLTAGDWTEDGNDAVLTAPRAADAMHTDVEHVDNIDEIAT